MAIFVKYIELAGVELDQIPNTQNPIMTHYMNSFPFKYYIHSLGRVGDWRLFSFCLFRGGVIGPKFRKTC